MPRHDYESIMASARARGEDMDTIDQCPPSRCPTDVHLRTAMEALKTGIALGDIAILADAQVLLETLHVRLTGRPWK